MPVARASAGSSGKTSNTLRPRIASRRVLVACAKASLTATMVKRGASGSSTRNSAGADSNSVRKSGAARGT